MRYVFMRLGVFSAPFLLLVGFVCMPVLLSAAPADHILITEVMYDPIDSGNDNRFEWIELFNPTNQTIDLEGWYLRDGDYNNGNYAPFSTEIPDGYELAPGDYLLVIFDESHIEQSVHSYGSHFIESLPPGTQVLETLPLGWQQHSVLRLNNDGDFLRLEDDQGNLIDYVEWEDADEPGSGQGWLPALVAAPGQSLCRISSTDDDSRNDWGVCNGFGDPGRGVYDYEMPGQMNTQLTTHSQTMTRRIPVQLKGRVLGESTSPDMQLQVCNQFGYDAEVLRACVIGKILLDAGKLEF